MMEKQVGQITHYFNRIGVAVLKLEEGLKVGDTIQISGHTTDFSQQVWSMEIDHHKMQEVGPGANVALKVDEPVRKGDAVYLVMERVVHF